MSRHCPNCGYPISGRPDYDDALLRGDGTFAEGGEVLPLQDDSVLGVLGDDLSDLSDVPQRSWWRLW